MAIVQILSPETIARIAAGEVVERPASVVKELVENALDAGATRVEVHLKAGGTSLIHVKDDGRGIARDDLAVLFQRHATSKISSAADLEKILSLGFRGEALYSIGAVAEVNIKSRAEGSAEAWECDVRGGVREESRPAAMAAQGTEIRVKEIFFNTPARRKFLKSDAAEAEQVLNVFLPYVLYFFDRHFILTHNGRALIDLPPAASALERAARALNLDARHLIQGEVVKPQDNISLRIVAGDINIQRPRRDLQFLFVNGRPVQSRGLLFHANDVYRLIMPDGVHPAFILFLDVAHAEVDVNIHPSKREVRIRQEARAGSILRAQLEQLLMTRGGAKEVGSGLAPEKIIFAPGQRSSLPESVPAAAPARPAVSVPLPPMEELFTAPVPAAARPSQDPLKERLLRSRWIGTFVNTYHLFEEGEALFVIDQHAAQERILFEKFRAQINAGKLEVQHLLTPVVVRLTAQERLAFDHSQEKLGLFGFEATLLDEGAIALHTSPALIAGSGPMARAAQALLGDDEGVKPDIDRLARRACRASVMAGDRMKGEEAVHQLQELMACADPFTCPHGRPVFVELKTAFFDRHFLRT